MYRTTILFRIGNVLSIFGALRVQIPFLTHIFQQTHLLRFPSQFLPSDLTRHRIIRTDRKRSQHSPLRCGLIFGNGFGGEGEFGRDDFGDGFERDGFGNGVPGLVGETFLEDESIAVGKETEIGGSA